jgi:hypothetical protein
VAKFCSRPSARPSPSAIDRKNAPAGSAGKRVASCAKLRRSLAGQRLEHASRCPTRLEGIEKRMLANRPLDLGQVGASLVEHLLAGDRALHGVVPSLRQYSSGDDREDGAQRRKPRSPIAFSFSTCRSRAEIARFERGFR